MGSWFSKSVSDEKDLKREEEYLKAIETLKKQNDDLMKAAQSAQTKKEEIYNEALKKQKEVSEERINEMEESIERLNNLKDSRKLLNAQASQLLCAIYFNYQFGSIIKDTKNINKLIDTCLNTSTFWLLCKVPQLLPLLWPTGSDCDEFHEYKRDNFGKIDVSDYSIFINSHIGSYVTGTLPGYIVKVCENNCLKYSDFDDDRDTKIGNKCKEYLEEVEEVETDEEWFKITMKLLNEYDKEDLMNWKCISARSRKGICKNKIELLPKTMPKLCPKYELYEGLLMLSNTAINQYGDLRNEAGTNGVLAGSNEKHTNGGQCFSINKTITESIYEKGLNGEEMWDCETYIGWDEVILSEKEVTGYGSDEIDEGLNESNDENLNESNENSATDKSDDNELNDDSTTDESDALEWMTKTSLCDETMIYGEDADGSGGYMKYVNPTQKYTRQFINDEGYIEVALKLPRLSAGITETFTKTFLKNIFTSLQKSVYQNFNVFSINNKNLLTSIDYIYITPFGFDQIDNVSPIARYIFEVLIQDSCKWTLTFPIENTMSMSKINSRIIKDKGIEYLPQYIWTRTNNVKFSVNKGGDVKSDVNESSEFKFDNFTPENHAISNN